MMTAGGTIDAKRRRFLTGAKTQPAAQARRGGRPRKVLDMLADVPDVLDADELRRLLAGVDGFRPLELIPTAIPYLPAPALEAHQLVTMIGRGSTADELRAVIDVTPRQAAFLRKVTSGDPLRSRTVELMIGWRQKVRTAFDAELANPALGANVPADLEA